MTNPLSIQPFMARIYNHCAPRAQQALHVVSKIWNQLPDFIDFQTMARHRVTALNNLIKIHGQKHFDYHLSIEDIQEDLLFYKQDLLNHLPKAKKCYARLPIELKHPFSSQIKCVSLHNIRFELIKTLPKFLKGTRDECIDYISSAIVKSFATNACDEAHLILDFSRSVNAFNDVFPKVMHTLIEKKDYKIALDLLFLVHSCPGLEDKKPTILDFLKIMLKKVANTNPSSTIEINEQQILIHGISQIIQSMKDQGPQVEEIKDGEENNSAINQISNTTGSSNERIMEVNTRQIETSSPSSLTAEHPPEISADIAYDSALSNWIDLFQTEVQKSNNGLNEESFDLLLCLATTFPIPSDKAKALNILLTHIQKGPLIRLDWIRNIESNLKDCKGYNDHTHSPLSHLHTNETLTSTSHKKPHENIVEIHEDDNLFANESLENEHIDQQNNTFGLSAAELYELEVQQAGNSFDRDDFENLRTTALNMPSEVEKNTALQTLLKSVREHEFYHPVWIERLEKDLGIYQHEYDDADYYPSKKKDPNRIKNSMDKFSITTRSTPNNTKTVKKQEENVGTPLDWFEKALNTPIETERDYWCNKFLSQYATEVKNTSEALAMIQSIENVEKRDNMLLLLFMLLRDMHTVYPNNDTYEYHMALVSSCITNTSLLNSI